MREEDPTNLHFFLQMFVYFIRLKHNSVIKHTMKVCPDELLLTSAVLKVSS